MPETRPLLHFSSLPAVTTHVQRSELADALADRAGIPRGQADRLLHDLLDVVATCLACGEDVVLRGLGTLHATTRSRPVFRHPGTGMVVEGAPAESRVVFRPSRALKSRMRRNRAAR